MIAKGFLLLSAAIVLIVGSPVENEVLDIESRQGTVNYRLTDDFIPISYEIELTPYFAQETGFEAFTFTGKATITLKALRPASTLVLHQNDLVITRYTVTSGTDVTTGTYDPTRYDSVTDKWTINLNAPASTSAPSITVVVEYSGFMREDMYGFYRTYYMENNEKVWMASTQFEQTAARRAFPCMDEPGFKAMFKVILRTPTDMSAISNTAVVNTRVEGTRMRFEFDWTPAMSTYLLAFIVSKYEGNIVGNFGVYARRAAKPQTDLASKIGIELLGKFDTYLGIPYSTLGIVKMDMAAIPDFSAGAMENWGLLTYRETNILHYLNDTPSISEQRIIAVIAHEQAHQWFGDSVTCKWWSEIWLNEGFARYFQYFGTEWVRSEWDLEEQFAVEQIQQAMQVDSVENTHPLTDKSVETKAQASDIFDNISYNKGASIIRMLSHHIGLIKFQETLNYYLTANRNQAVEPAQLFAAIDTINPVTAGQLKVSEIFLPWTTQSGFPLVTVERENRTLRLTQKRFSRSGSTTKTDKYNIPITFSIDSDNYNDTSTKFFLYASVEGNTTFDLPRIPERYYILNNKQAGFYRVNYDEENWRNIKEALFKDNHDNIDVLSRTQIVDDLFNLARAGIVKYDTAIDIIRYIKKEKHYAPWLSAITHGLTFLSQRVSEDSDQKTFAWFIRDLMGDVYKHLNFLPAQSDRQTDIYNRANILSWVCKYGHEECIRLSRELFDKFMLNPTEKVPKDHRVAVYCNAIREGNATHFDFLYDRFLTEDISAEQLNIMSGLSCTKEPALVTRYLNRLTETEEIRPQDRIAVINNILNANPEGPQWVYNYITQNHTRWNSALGSLSTLTTIAGRFTTKAQFDEYSTFLVGKQAELGASFSSLNTALTSARANLEWDAKYFKEFMDHLKHLESSSPAKVVSILATLISLFALYIFN